MNLFTIVSAKIAAIFADKEQSKTNAVNAAARFFDSAPGILQEQIDDINSEVEVLDLQLREQLSTASPLPSVLLEAELEITRATRKLARQKEMVLGGLTKAIATAATEDDLSAFVEAFTLYTEVENDDFRNSVVLATLQGNVETLKNRLVSLQNNKSVTTSYGYYSLATKKAQLEDRRARLEFALKSLQESPTVPPTPTTPVPTTSDKSQK